MIEVQIQPVTVWNNQATKIRIEQVYVQLDNTASCNYALVSDDGSELIRNGASLTPEQYALWSDNDEYFVDCIIANLRLTKQ